MPASFSRSSQGVERTLTLVVEVVDQVKDKVPRSLAILLRPLRVGLGSKLHHQHHCTGENAYSTCLGVDELSELDGETARVVVELHDALGSISRPSRRRSGAACGLMRRKLELFKPSKVAVHLRLVVVV